ncbi:hypothetical protein PWT90_00628 [Aphanocladium album]|nr:hypothetical protein PWT90_00628 [Aphanocladium album]
MRLSYSLATIAALYSQAAVADFTTPTYPTPADLSSNHSVVHAAWGNLTTGFDRYLQGKLNGSAAAALAGVENVTFSVGLFSLSDPEALKLQYHHTSKEIEAAKVGTNKVDENSIYRVASVSKLITVFAGLLELRDEDWHRPLSEIDPVFKTRAQNSSEFDVIKSIQWDKITPWALATQLSGVPTLGPLTDVYDPSLAANISAPILQNITSLGGCIPSVVRNRSDGTCTPAEAASSLNAESPNFLPFKTPVYSDIAFMLLGVAISSLSNKTMTEVYQSAVFRPLNMTSSSDKSENKTLSRAVVVGTQESYEKLDIAPFTAPSGGILSTISDLRKLGLGILNSTLLPQEATDKWMKPVSLTASLSYAIGAPWEIHRFVHPKSGKVTDIYTKLGDSGTYGGALALIPQYDAGFAMLNAASGPERSDVALGILDAVTGTVLPALEAQAAAEAKRNFVGEYKSSNGNVNATIKIAYNETVSATEPHSNLVLTEWTYNGTDVLTNPNVGLAGAPQRLEQSIVRRDPRSGRPRQIAFFLSSYAQAPTYETAKMGSWTGFYHSNGDFAYTDHVRWGGRQLRELVFDLDERGAAVKCTPWYQRLELTRLKK